MSSVIDTTAVAFRRGTKAQNDRFTGVEGEITVDLGEPDDSGNVQATDGNATIRVHNGITEGGISMCRADMQNMTTYNLAHNRPLVGDKNLLYSDLSNISMDEETTTKESTKQSVQTALSYYDMATKAYSDEKDEEKANKDMSNVDFSVFGMGTKPLAYADASNIDRTELAKTFAYADASNINRTELAKTFATVTQLNTQFNKCEVLTNKQKNNLIDSGYPTKESEVSDDKYPTCRAVYNYVQNKLDIQGDYITKNFKNVDSWEPLYTNLTGYYDYGITEKLTDCSTMDENVDYPTNIFLNKDSKDDLCIYVTKIDSNGKILEAEFVQTVVDYTDIKEELKSLKIKSATNVEATINYRVLYSDKYDCYYLGIDTIDCPENAGFKIYENEETQQFIKYKNISGAYSYINLKVISKDEEKTLVISPTEGYTLLDNVTVTILTGDGKEETTTEQISVNSYNQLPNAGGAGLLKNNLSNLNGWSISKTEAIKNPSQTTTDTDKARIVTAGLVQDYMRTILSTVYPVGSVYIGTQTSCPMASLISGSTWTLVSSGKALWTGNGSNANTTINAGLPNITGTFVACDDNRLTKSVLTGAFYDTKNTSGTDRGGSEDQPIIGFDASRSNSIYGNSTTVQPPAYVVNVWRRTA